MTLTSDEKRKEQQRQYQREWYKKNKARLYQKKWYKKKKAKLKAATTKEAIAVAQPTVVLQHPDSQLNSIVSAYKTLHSATKDQSLQNELSMMAIKIMAENT